MILVLILSLFISCALAFETSQLQWEQGGSYTLRRGDVISAMNYSLKIIAFPSPVESDKYKEVPEEPVEPFVGLNLSKNGIYIGTIILRQGESYITPDGDLKITAKTLPAQNSIEWLFENYSPWAEIELAQRGIPGLSLTVDTDNTRYISSSDQDIVATVTLENAGSADAFNIDMVIDTELPVIKGKLKYHYDRLKAGEPIIETLTFSKPVITKQKTHSISAKVRANDVMDSIYTAESLANILITVEPVQSLSIQKSSSSTKMYLKDYSMISLSLKNNGKYDIKSVTIKDSIPTGFKLLGNHTLRWVVDIPAGGEWDYRYLIKPLEPDKEGILFPVATAEFSEENELYSIRSNQPKIVVYGPKISLRKLTDVSEINPGDTVTVTVIAENTGSTPTKIFINDTLPENASFVSGRTALEDYLEVNNAVNFSYMLQIDSGKPIKLPPATAVYYELGTMGEKKNTTSQEPEIGIKSLPTPVPTQEIIIEETVNVDFSQGNITNSSNGTNGSVIKNSPSIFDIFWNYFTAVLTVIAFMGILLVTFYRQGFGI